MQIEDIKKQMIEFRDFYGEDLLDVADVETRRLKKNYVKSAKITDNTWKTCLGMQIITLITL